MIKFRLLLPLHSKRQLLSESPPLRLFSHGWNNEVYIRRVGVRIDHGKHRNTEAIGFTHSNVLLHYVYHEQGCRQTIQVGNRTEHLFQLGTLTGNL